MHADVAAKLRIDGRHDGTVAVECAETEGLLHLIDQEQAENDGHDRIRRGRTGDEHEQVSAQAH